MTVSEQSESPLRLRLRALMDNLERRHAERAGEPAEGEETPPTGKAGQHPGEARTIDLARPTPPLDIRARMAGDPPLPDAANVSTTL